MSNYEVNVLVNGSRCKIYSHNGKRFIEAKAGSNYVLEIKNNSNNRVLAVSSVDSLNTITGKNEAAETGAGYVLNSYTSTKIDGFRINDTEVAQFKFDIKSNGYAASKKDGSEKNSGVIGIRIFNEKPNPIVNSYITSYINPYIINLNSTGYPTPVYNASNCNSGGKLRNTSTLNSTTFNINEVNLEDCQYSSNLNHTIETKGFDMSTAFGESKESKVVEVAFERECVIESVDLYYATRQSLIEMGVPITNEKQVSFPEPFKESKYCKPPKNWKK